MSLLEKSRVQYQAKILSEPQLLQKIKELRAAGKTIATLNGSFDLLHAGHLHMIDQAALQADVLVLLLNTDASIKRYKSKDRPLIPLAGRQKMVAALEVVDLVSSFGEDDPRKILAEIAPDVHVNGAEYGENCLERETVEQGGGRLHMVTLIPGLSTSAIIHKIRELDAPNRNS
ncbi:MAG: D-beta-D-heptose 1-phosphate adenylyltransferase [Chlamydiae bacterium]|nr:D-beta-D-heptose 1-phosphate adenylyltransferase [Chlamydiota bacterium]